MNWYREFKKSQMNNEKTVYILRGVSGTGKSTMSKELQQQFGVGTISADHFFTDPVTGRYNFDPSKIGEAHRQAQAEFAKAINSGQQIIIVDNTNTTFSEMKYYAKMAVDHGYKVEFKEPDWHPSLKTPQGKWNADFIEQLQQSDERKSQNKTLPRNVIDRMVNRYQYNPTIESVLNAPDIQGKK